MHQILIVEDDRINSLVLQRFLDSDYSFDVAYSGHQALEYLERKKYDLVLMDINLGDPSLDGVEVLRRYQKTAKNQNTPSIAVTAYAMMGDYLEFSLLKAGEKGFQTIHLAGMWAKIMKAAMQIPQTHVRHGALEVKAGAAMLEECGIQEPLLGKLYGSNTAREMYTHLEEASREDVIRKVLIKARDYARQVSDKEVRVYLVDAKAKVVEHV